MKVPEDINSLSVFRDILKEEYTFKNTRHSRFFNSEGNEITNDTLTLIKEGETVYVEPSPEKSFNFLNILKQYDVMQKLGQGGFGKVYKAQHKKTHQIVAIKFIDITNYRILSSNQY